MHHPHRRWARAAAAAAFLLVASAAPLRACSIVPQYWVRDPARPALVVEALADSVYLGVFIPHRWDGPTFQPVPDSARATPIYGQVFRVREVVAAGNGLPAEVRPGARVVVIRWGLGGMCERVEPWPPLPAGTPAFFAPRPRPREEWVAGLPTFEVDASDEHDYVPMRWRHTQGHWLPRALRTPPMTAAEYGTMYRAMPTRQAWRHDPRRARMRVLRWARANPWISQRAPAPGMLRSLPYTERWMRDEAPRAEQTPP